MASSPSTLPGPAAERGRPNAGIVLAAEAGAEEWAETFCTADHHALGRAGLATCDRLLRA
ncbi:hypothetical protein SGPA1_50485 [Streptomyces misionensis JCM 4497]